MKAKLLNTVNRIYEIQLARLELLSLGAKNVSLDFDNLELNFDFIGDLERLKRRVSWLEFIENEPTWIKRIIVVNRKILRQYADIWFSHFLYPFKARFRPPVARSAINIVCPEEQGIILDPFTGSGTTNIEAATMELDSIGIDINPFYTFMTEAKYQFYTKRIEEESFAEAFWNSLDSGNLFHKSLQQKGHPIFPVLYSCATCMHFKDPEKAFFKKYQETKTLQDEWWKIKHNYKLGKLETKVISAEFLPYRDDSIDGIVTSPPYSNALNYLKENRGAPEFFEISEKLKVQYEATKSLEIFYEMIERAILEMIRVIKPRRKIVFIIGNQRRKGEVIPIIDFCIEKFQKLRCKLLYNIPQLISSTGTWNILTDCILIFQKLPVLRPSRKDED